MNDNDLDAGRRAKLIAPPIPEQLLELAEAHLMLLDRVNKDSDFTREMLPRMMTMVERLLDRVEALENLFRPPKNPDVMS